MYNVSENAVPTQYPIALGSCDPAELGAYDQAWCEANANGPYLQTVKDAHGCSEKPAPSAVLAAKLQNPNFLREELAKAYPQSGHWYDKLGPNAELLSGVKNYYILRRRRAAVAGAVL